MHRTCMKMSKSQTGSLRRSYSYFVVSLQSPVVTMKILQCRMFFYDQFHSDLWSLRNFHYAVNFPLDGFTITYESPRKFCSHSK